jgi:hypothetical protein
VLLFSHVAEVPCADMPGIARPRRFAFLTVPPTVLMRLRYSPFFSYVERWIEDFLE